jgi:3-oxoacyl-[acyl-carrier protein] reductase
VNGHATTGKLAGTTAVVTGAARGLRRAYALRLAAFGADAAVVDIRLEAAREYGEAMTEASVPVDCEAIHARRILEA